LLCVLPSVFIFVGFSRSFCGSEMIQEFKQHWRHTAKLVAINCK
jgi:hypothetical protein